MTVEANSAIISDGESLQLLRPDNDNNINRSDQLLVALYFFLEAHPYLQQRVLNWYQQHECTINTTH